MGLQRLGERREVRLMDPCDAPYAREIPPVFLPVRA